MIIHLVPEGYLEEAVGGILLAACGHRLGRIYNSGRGCNYIRNRAALFRHLATDVSGVLVLTDFRDTRAPCVTAALQEYIWSKAADIPRTFLCRFAVAELESWLLADRYGLAGFLRVAVVNIPREPEKEAFPKRTLVNLARASRKTSIREGLAPPSGHRASVGPEYTSLLREFIAEKWNVEAAMQRAPSLERCVRRLCDLPAG
jgi:hypothetical protein